MRKILFLFTFFSVAGVIGPGTKEVAAQCTHLGGSGACPVGITNGSTSVSFNADGTINWDSGGISGPCCAAPGGTETGAGLLDLNNELGRNPFRYGPDANGAPGGNPLSGNDEAVVTGEGFEDRSLGTPNCGFGGCGGNDVAGEIFGANPNSGYLCDTGGPGCGNDLWVSVPQPGFGQCGPGGCTGGSPFPPLTFVNTPGGGRYTQNRTTGEVDPFGGAGNSFTDPITGESEAISLDPANWPSHVKHADELNTAYVNGEIPYPFNDPDWINKSIEDFDGDPGSFPVSNASSGPNFYPFETGGPQPGFGSPQRPSNLTEYVNAFISTQPGARPADFVSVLPAVTPAPAPATTPTNEDTEEADEPRSESTSLRTRNFDSRTGWDNRSSITRVETEGEETVYTVETIEDGKYQFIDFKSREDAFLFSDRLNDAPDGKTMAQVLGELPAERAPVNVGSVNTNLTDTLTKNVPKEFQAPKVNEIRRGEYLITDPRTGRSLQVRTAAQRDNVLNAMNNGATLEQAAQIANSAAVVTPDGLASATSSSTPRSTRSTPAPAGSTPTFTNNQPAIIVAPDVTTTPDGLASANSGGGSTPSTPAPAGSVPTVVNERPAIIVPPTRPEGTSAGTMTGLLNGNSYDIEVIKTPDGRTLAVGTGENANHVFGEVKESSNKLFGDWRREGPWTPPPAKTQTAAAPEATPAPSPGTQQSPTALPVSPQTANAQVRSEIANSDRDHMIQSVFTDKFESGDRQEWRTTNP